MLDQANELRRLVLQAALGRSARAEPAPRMVVVAGGTTRVGTTTTAVNLAVAFAEQACRTVLVDANLEGAAVATQCGLTVRYTLDDVLHGRRTIHEVLQRGPAGIQIVPGASESLGDVRLGDLAVHRLVSQFRTLGRHADITVVDAGLATAPLARQLTANGDDLVLVSSPDPTSVTQTYAAIKSQSDTLSRTPWLVVSRAATDAEAEDAHRRLAMSCRRFLGVPLEWLGWVPEDEAVARGGTTPLVIAAPHGIAATELATIATRLLNEPPASLARAA